MRSGRNNLSLARAALRLRIAGRSYADIGRELGTSEQHALRLVREDLARLAPPKATADAKFLDRLRIGEIDDVERLFWEAHTRADDPTFLRGVQWCIDRRCELLGL
jgi:hypothetical protein